MRNSRLPTFYRKVTNACNFLFILLVFCLQSLVLSHMYYCPDYLYPYLSGKYFLKSILLSLLFHSRMPFLSLHVHFYYVSHLSAFTLSLFVAEVKGFFPPLMSPVCCVHFSLFDCPAVDSDLQFKGMLTLAYGLYHMELVLS